MSRREQQRRKRQAAGFAMFSPAVESRVDREAPYLWRLLHAVARCLYPDKAKRRPGGMGPVVAADVIEHEYGGRRSTFYWQRRRAVELGLLELGDPALQLHGRFGRGAFRMLRLPGYRERWDAGEPPVLPVTVEGILVACGLLVRQHDAPAHGPPSEWLPDARALLKKMRMA